MTVTATFRVAGMTCGHCAQAVTDELGRLDGAVSEEVRATSAAGESLK
jgi:copper chaperone CopZ